MSPCPPPTQYSDRPIHRLINPPIQRLILYRKPSSLLCIIACPYIASLTALYKAFPLSTPDAISQSLIASSPRYRYRSSLLHTYVKSSIPLPSRDAILRFPLSRWICPCEIQRPAFIPLYSNHSRLANHESPV